MTRPVYALNLFNVANRDEYLAYSRRSPKEVVAHGGRVVALGKFREAAHGDDPGRMGIESGLRRLPQRSKNCRPASAPGEGRLRLRLAPFRQA
jgi:hypothetical protein